MGVDGGVEHTELRAMKLSQLRALRELAKKVLGATEVQDPHRDNKKVVYKASSAQEADLNMHILNKLIVKRGKSALSAAG